MGVEMTTPEPIFGTAASASRETLDRDAGMAAEFFRCAEERVRQLPPKRDRDEHEQAAAEALLEAARAVRTRLLRVYAELIYEELTDGYGRFVRLHELVYAAAERFPGLVPTHEEIVRERQVPQKEKDGLEIDQGIFFGQLLSRRTPGLHLVQAMLRPTTEAAELLPRFRAEGALDLGPVLVERVGKAGYVTLRNIRYLNAEDDATVRPMEIAVDLVLLDPAIEVGVLRGAVVEHPKYAGRRAFHAGITLTHLYEGKISFVDFYLMRDFGFVNKFYRGLAGSEFWPDEPEA